MRVALVIAALAACGTKRDSDERGKGLGGDIDHVAARVLPGDGRRYATVVIGDCK